MKDWQKELEELSELSELSVSSELSELSELPVSSEWRKGKNSHPLCFRLPALFLFYSSLVPVVL